MNSYIANSRVATGLRDGSITAIMVRCKFKKKIQNPQVGFSVFCQKGKEFSVSGVHKNGRCGESIFKLPYTLGKEVYVREAITHTALAMAIYKADNSPVMKNGEQLHIDSIAPNTGYVSACSENYTRTWITPVSVECVRVKDLYYRHWENLGWVSGMHENQSLYADHIIQMNVTNEMWNNNEYVFIYQVKTRII